MARHRITRALLIAGSVLLVGSTHTKASPPPTDGIVTVRTAGDAANSARLGFLVGDNGKVVAYLGSNKEEDVAGAGFVIRASDGTEVAGSSVAYDGATGLALMQISGSLPKTYVFAREPVSSLRLVYGATLNDTTGQVEIVRGTESGIESASETESDGPGWITHDVAVGDQGIGSPLFNTCGHVVGVIVQDNPDATGGSGKAVPSAWLEHGFGDRGLVLAWTDEECVTEIERSDVVEQEPVVAEKGLAQTVEPKKQTSTRMGDREETADTARGVSNEPEDGALAATHTLLSARQRAWRAFGVVGGLSLLLALLWIARRLSEGGARPTGLAAEMIAGGAKPAVPPTETREPAAMEVPDVFLDGRDQQRELSLRIPGLSIAGPSGAIVGRNPFEGAFVLNQEEVSRRHFRLFISDGQLMVEDLDSMNGTEIDGSVLAAGSPCMVRNGSQLAVGRFKLTVRLQARAEELGEDQH